MEASTGTHTNETKETNNFQSVEDIKMRRSSQKARFCPDPVWMATKRSLGLLALRGVALSMGVLFGGCILGFTGEWLMFVGPILAGCWR